MSHYTISETICWVCYAYKLIMHEIWNTAKKLIFTFYKLYLPNNSLNLHSALIWSAISAIMGKYMNQTNDDAPKWRRKFSFWVLCSYVMVFRSSYRNHIIMALRNNNINHPGQVWYSSMSSMISTSVWK